jgi:hypothetical protein
VAESVKEKIFQELKKLLETIKKDNGYETEVRVVHSEVVPIGDIADFPAIIIDQGAEENLTGSGTRRTMGLMEKRMTVFLDCFIYEADNMQRAIRKIEQDIEKLFWGDKYSTAKGYSINNTAFELDIIRSEPFGTIIDRPNGGTSIELAIYYHQKDTDPTLKA